MKKKIDLQHFYTDVLVTSDEWESFDYYLQSQIKELAEIGYDNRPQFWKNNLAYSYLWHVEKLLLEKSQCGNHEIENIRELQTLIEKYDHLKTFLLTLRIATIAYRAGLIPKMVKAEADKQTNRKRKMEALGAIIYKAISNVLEKARTPKLWTLGYVMLQFDNVNKGKILYDCATVHVGQKNGKKGVYIIGLDNKEIKHFKERSLQKFIDEYKKFHSKVTL